MNYRDELTELLATVLRAPPFSLTNVPDVASLLTIPKDTSHGDWAFPTFIVAKELKKAPPQVANDLIAALRTQLAKAPFISRVQAVGPYVNFVINKGALASTLIPSIISGEFLARRTSTNERVMIEYSQPNTHKAFHVGHIRCAALGDSITRIFEWSGFTTVPVNYIGDEGTHVAKCLWYLQTFFHGEPPLQNRGEFLGILYTKATELLDLNSLTRAAVPGVVAAKIVSAVQHPKEPRLSVVELLTTTGARTVVTGAKGFKPGDVVPYAPVGVEINGKVVGTVTRHEIESSGMMLSERELGLSEDNDTVPVLPPSSELGAPVVEIYRIEGAVPEGKSVLGLLAERAKEVSAVLKEMESGEGPVHDLWKKTKQWSMDEFHQIYAWLDCRFDHYFFESECGDESRQLVREYQERGVFVESDGAIGANLREWNLGFCVLIKRDGTMMYAARDLALARQKFDGFKIDRSIYVVDSAQTFHFQQVFKCLDLMGFKQVKHCYHLPYAQVVRPDGKMSSRKGNVILFSQLRERLISKITSEFLEKYRHDWSDDEISTAAHRIALATMRYGMLNQDHGSLIVFDLDAWTARTGNTGPYMMYAYARTRSILRELGEIDRSRTLWSLLTHENEADLITFLGQYHATVQRAREEYLPLVICVYLYELSKKFNRMYQTCSVINAETPELRAARAGLVEATGLVLQHGLALLGISTIERM